MKDNPINLVGEEQSILSNFEPEFCLTRQKLFQEYFHFFINNIDW